MTQENDCPELPHASASYSPEDNKLRLYTASRLDAETYARVKAAGFRWAPKQELFVAPSWSPAREDLLLALCGEIDDEDYSPEERAADRAERFAGYRDKRSAEATGRADTFDAGPSAFGHQSRARAELQAMRHDRHRVHAVSQWSKAEYWQERTHAVISHALHKSSAEVRRGRILAIEADLRKLVASYTPTDNPPHIINQQEYSWSTGTYLHEGAAVPHVWVGPKGRGGNWVPVARLEAMKQGSQRWIAHYENRLAYERAMLANEGGTAAEADMEPGGWIGSHQIHGVNRSPVTGRVVSVKLLAPKPYWRGDGPAPLTLQLFNIERMGQDAYRSPTDEEREAFKAQKKASKKPPVSLINPTTEDAQRLQDALNRRAADKAREKGRNPSDPRKVESVDSATWTLRKGAGIYSVEQLTFRDVTFKVRVGRRGYDYNAAQSVIVLTDKPQKPLPLDWEAVASGLVEQLAGGVS